MRYSNGSNVVELTSGMSNDFARPNVAVWIVVTDLPVLPTELGAEVLQSDSEGFETLKKTLSSWADAHGYMRVEPDPGV